MTKPNFIKDTQSILSIGYIYLVVMGILNETLFYSQVGINIMKYSSILDVLISPISRLTAEIVGVIFFLILIAAIFYLPKKLSGKAHKSWFKKAFKLDDGLTKTEIEKSLFDLFVFGAFLGIFGFFVGTGIGGGGKVAQKIRNNEINYNDNLTFIRGEKRKVSIIGTNSNYIFYLTSGNNNVLVTPIAGVIESIEEVDE